MRECKKHKFKPRYDYVFPEKLLERIKSINAESVDSMNAFKNKYYKCEICIKCGKIILPHLHSERKDYDR